MSKYRKKPVVIEAVRWTGENIPEMFDFLGNSSWSLEPNTINILTLEGTMRADIGDWIIRGVQGEFYPCKPDIFEMTYELVK